MTRPGWLTRNVLFLGLVSLFTDAATEMAMPLMPAFIASLGGGALAVGGIEGAADFTASLLKYWSGRWSDALGRRKPLVLLGYGISTTVRPFLALAGTPLQALFIRVTDRIGKGLRSSPRDALLSASVPDAARGRAFGFLQALDHSGAVLGALLAVALLALTQENLRLIFALSAIPGLLALFSLAFGVKEARLGPLPGKSKPPLHRPSKEMLKLIIPLAVFSLGASSDLFLLMKAGAAKTPLYGIPLLWIALHLVKAASAIPGGWVADHAGERPTIQAGWLLYAAVYLAFAFTESRAAILGLLLVYGLYYGLTEGPEKSLISKLAPEKSRASAFGWYNLTVGILVLPANLFFGWLWDAHGQRAAFLSGASFALAGAALLFLFNPAPLPSRRRA